MERWPLSRSTLIIGGTGTLGRALLERIDPSDCVVFSRDELKHQEIKRKYPGVATFIGDIRDQSGLTRCMAIHRPKRVFHVAALKHVDVLEENPEEAFLTNIEGTINVAETASMEGVEKLYFTSTDKAVLPINVYGMTKALAESYLLNRNVSRRKFDATQYLVFRWGNIIGSRGSAINFFLDTLVREGKAYITDRSMTRFWMKIEDAVDYMLKYNGPIDRVNFPVMKAASVVDVIKACAVVLDVTDYKLEVCGVRPGEKIHECLYSSHEMCIRSDTGLQYTFEELVHLVETFVASKKVEITSA